MSHFLLSMHRGILLHVLTDKDSSHAAHTLGFHGSAGKQNCDIGHRIPENLHLLYFFPVLRAANICLKYVQVVMSAVISDALGVAE